MSGRSNIRRRALRQQWVKYAVRNLFVAGARHGVPDKITGGYYRACFDVYWCHRCRIWHYRGARRFPIPLWFVAEHQPELNIRRIRRK